MPTCRSLCTHLSLTMYPPVRYLKFWIDSVYLNTSRGGEVACAPFILIGTHKDLVPDPAQHERISTELCSRFDSSIAWPLLISYEGRLGIYTSTLNPFKVSSFQHHYYFLTSFLTSFITSLVVGTARQRFAFSPLTAPLAEKILPFFKRCRRSKRSSRQRNTHT